MAATRHRGRKSSMRWILWGVIILAVSVAIAWGFRSNTSMRLFDRLPLRNNDIVLLGDSHFEYFDAAEMLNDKRIRNRGISGQTSAEMLRRMDEIERAGPRMILLLAGANDAFQKRGTEAYLRDMEQLIARAKAAAKGVAVLSIPPTTDREFQPELDRYNAVLTRLCERLDVTYIDLRPALEKDGLLDPALTYDGLHLNTDGYRRIVPLIKPFLKAPDRTGP